MKWSIPCGQLFGIRIGLHISFLLLLAWVAWMGWEAGGPLTSLWALVLVVCLFTCVVLHELGHSLVAIRFGVHVDGITLLPIGGVAMMRAIPERPLHEFLIAVAGPLVNVVIAAALLLVRGRVPAWAEAPVLPGSASELLDALIFTNIVLVVFNLVPAFPMDGGRILRSLLAMRFSYRRATDVAAAAGQAFAVLFMMLGLWHNPLLLVIGVVVFLGARTEQQRVRMRSLLRHVLVEDVMVTDFVTLHPDAPLEQCLAHVYHRRQEDFPVAVDGRLVGLLPRREWLAALHRSGGATPVGAIMRKRFVSVYPKSELAAVYQDLRTLEQGAFPVLQGGRVVGLLTMEEISRFLMVERARRRRPAGQTADDGGEGRVTVDLG